MCCMLVPSFRLPSSVSIFRDWFLPIFRWLESLTLHLASTCGIEAILVALDFLSNTIFGNAGPGEYCVFAASTICF